VVRTYKSSIKGKGLLSGSFMGPRGNFVKEYLFQRRSCKRHDPNPAFFDACSSSMFIHHLIV
jgi:hypothetical protein